MLGKAGANVVLACRSPDKAQAAKRDLEKQVKGTVDLVQLDLSDLASVRAAADEVRRNHTQIDGLINNAGIMQTPKRKTKDGFELQFGTNHLSHFLWTRLLIDLVDATAGRVVVVSSIAHKFGEIDLDDLMWETGYTPSKAYFRSKLANIMFAFELDRRLQANGCKSVCIACHPGYANTNLQSTGRRPGPFRPRWPRPARRRSGAPIMARRKWAKRVGLSAIRSSPNRPWTKRWPESCGAPART